MNFLKIRLHFLLSVILTQIMSDFLKFVILFLAIPVGLVISVEGRAQEIDTVLTKFESGKVVVNYTFAKGTPDENYELYLYGSHDNFTRPMQQTIGDIGKNIRPGGQKIIYWDANRGLGNFREANTHHLSVMKIRHLISKSNGEAIIRSSGSMTKRRRKSC